MANKAIIINLPNSPDKAEWTNEQLVRVGHAIQGAYKTHLEEIKAVLRARKGPEGGQVTDGQTLSVTVSKLGQPTPKTDWAQVGKEAIAVLKAFNPQAAADIVAANTEIKQPSAQSVRF